MPRKVTKHFTWDELGYTDAPPNVQARLQHLAASVLEPYRAAVYGGRPMRITSAFRSPAKNRRTRGAVPSSAHLTGDAADFIPPVPIEDAIRLHREARAAGRCPAFGEIIFYPAKGHIHITSPGIGGDHQELAGLPNPPRGDRWIPLDTFLPPPPAPQDTPPQV